MTNRKIVSIEDRIPKLKQVRKKKANQRLVFYLSIFFLLISIIIYLQSPLSNIKTIHITGNSLMSEKEIIQKSKLTYKTNIWTVNKDEIEQKLHHIPVIKSAKVNRKLPWTVEIHLAEFERVGYIKKGGEFHPVLGDGTTLPSLKDTLGDAPIILDFKEDEYLNRMTAELQKLPLNILNLISEIHWAPIDENKNKIILYMSDGFVVDGSIRNFAEKMQIYPSIVSQLHPESQGIIHIGIGAYFEEFKNDDNNGN